MNTKILFFLLIAIGFCSYVHAQEDDDKIRVKGLILDEVSHQPLPFTNVGIVGTVAGVASDMDGYFELSVPARYATHVLRISAIGYAPMEIKIYELQEQSNPRVFLKPVSYALKNVEVVGEWQVIKGLLDRVVANIRQNYIPRSYNYEGYFEYGITVNGEEKRSKEAIVTIYDNQGYIRGDVEQAFTALNYKLNHIRRSHEPLSAAEGMMYFDDILTADIVRHSRNILNTEHYRDFTFKDMGKFIYEGDSVQIIAYETSKPTLTNSGNADAIKYSGEVYIQLKDAVVIKNIMRITSGNFNRMGRDLIPVEEPERASVTTTITTNYKKVSSYYFLSGITSVYEYTEGGDRIKGEVQYQTTKVKTDNIEPFAGRIYFENMDPDYRFWDRYVITLEAEE